MLTDSQSNVVGSHRWELTTIADQVHSALVTGVAGRYRSAEAVEAGFTNWHSPNHGASRLVVNVGPAVSNHSISRQPDAPQDRDGYTPAGVRDGRSPSYKITPSAAHRSPSSGLSGNFKE